MEEVDGEKKRERKKFELKRERSEIGEEGSQRREKNKENLGEGERARSNRRGTVRRDRKRELEEILKEKMGK